MDLVEYVRHQVAETESSTKLVKAVTMAQGMDRYVHQNMDLLVAIVQVVVKL
jgi:hypothetical protein